MVHTGPSVPTGVSTGERTFQDRETQKKGRSERLTGFGKVPELETHDDPFVSVDAV